MFSSLHKTADFGLATALLTNGFELAGVDKENPRRVYFMFENSNEVQETITNYWNGTLLQPTNKVMDSIKHLKAVMYA
jgi:hypothetical protein